MILHKKEKRRSCKIKFSNATGEKTGNPGLSNVYKQLKNYSKSNANSTASLTKTNKPKKKHTSQMSTLTLIWQQNR